MTLSGCLPSPMTARLRRCAAGLLLSGAAPLISGCRDPRAEANIAEAMIQVGVEIDALQQEYAILQFQVDSMRSVIARQDTALSRLTMLVHSLPR